MFGRATIAALLFLAHSGQAVRSQDELEEEMAMIGEDEEGVVGLDADVSSGMLQNGCRDGVFVLVAKQPALGMVHMPVGSVASSFARLSHSRGCTTDYSLGCVDDRASVSTSTTCPDGVKASSDISHGTAEWEACSGEGGTVSLLEAVIDSTYLTEMSSGTPLSGCLQVVPADAWPELSAVRGSHKTQAAALAVRKAKVGGCPLARSQGDRLARSADFADRARWVRRLREDLTKRAKLMAGGRGNMWENREREHVGQLYNLLAPETLHSERVVLADPELALINCGEPMPLVGGPMLFQHKQVSAAAADPTAARSYSTLTMPQTEKCFDQSSLLFQSSGSPEHTQTRRLLDEAGFDRLHLEPLPELARIQHAGAEPKKAEVGQTVLSLLLHSIWQQQPSKEAQAAILPYLTNGAACSFGSLVNKMEHKVRNIQRARNAMADLGKQSPRFTAFQKLMESGRYLAAKDLHGQSGLSAAEQLVRNVGDASLFSGFLPTAHLATKCVQQLWADPTHVRMFRANRTAYLHELARIDSGSAGFTTALKEEQSMVLEGHTRKLPAGTPVKMLLASANRDPTVFLQPALFNPMRLEAQEQLAWNGRLADVVARDYARAPRFCPGYQLSMAIATKACDHFTQHLTTET